MDSIKRSYDGEEGEDLQDYRIGGYHPVEVEFEYFLNELGGRSLYEEI